MSVDVDFFGRTGNNLFQYTLARLIAEKSNLKLTTPWCAPDFIETTPHKDGDIVMGDMIRITDVSSNPLSHDYGQNHVHLHGYFQDATLYNDYREDIKKFFVLKKLEKNTEDICMHLRLTDYWWDRNKSVIHPLWYHGILRGEKYRKLYIVVEPHCTNDVYLRYFKQFDPVIISGSKKDDFDFIRSFDRIVCSNSTFAWWAAFLSDASKIWTFKPWMNKKCVSVWPKLPNMEGATMVDGSFIGHLQLERIDWTDYWKQPNSFFGRK
jgi:hypothetical protein